MNHDHSAHPVRDMTIYTPSQFRTGDIEISTPGVHRGDYILYSFMGLLNIINNFIVAGDKDYFPGPNVIELIRFPVPSILTNSPFVVMALTLLRKTSEVI